jgi:hypothetical protein
MPTIKMLTPKIPTVKMSTPKLQTTNCRHHKLNRNSNPLTTVAKCIYLNRKSQYGYILEGLELENVGLF